MSAPLFPLEIQELRGAGRSYTVYVRWHTTIKNVKDQLRNIIKGFPISRMQIFHASSTKAISNQTTLHDLGIDRAGPHALRLALMVASSSPQYLLVSSKDIQLDEECDYMLEQVRLGLHCGHKPTKTDMLDCTGGVYFMKSGSNVPFAVFKPNDEEQGMPNNPKGHAGNGDVGLRQYFSPGEGYIRETASYILDKDNFCGVPPTTIVHCEHDTFHYPRTPKGSKPTFPKLGSLQKFIRAADTFEDISPSKVGILELQKIALLDMRLLNCDRNASNILIVRKPPASFYNKSSSGSSTKVTAATNANGRKQEAKSRSSTPSSDGSMNYATSQMEFHEFFFEDAIGSRYMPASTAFGEMYDLVPIDHGYCIPTKLQIDEFDWVWFTCSQVAAEVAPEIKEYMNSLDIDALLEKLVQQIALPDDCLFLLRVTHQLLVEGINAGLTLRDIASLIARVDEDVPSPLEVAIAAADENALRAVEMRSERRTPHGMRSSPSLNKSFCSPGRSTSRGSTAIPMELQCESINEELAIQHVAALVQQKVSSVKNNTEGDLSPSVPVGLSPLRSLAAERQSAVHADGPVTRPAAVHADMPSSSQRRVRRVVNSVQNLSSMDRSNSPQQRLVRPNPTDLIRAAIVPEGVVAGSSNIGYLSSENIEKLQRSPDLLKFPLPFDSVGKNCAFQSPVSRQTSKQSDATAVPASQQEPCTETKNSSAALNIDTEFAAEAEHEDDYFCGEIAELKLAPADSPTKLPGYGSYLLAKQNAGDSLESRHPGVSLGLSSARQFAKHGDALSSMKSLDPTLLTPSTAPHVSSFSALSPGATPKTTDRRQGMHLATIREGRTPAPRALCSELGKGKPRHDERGFPSPTSPLSPNDGYGAGDVHPLSVLGGSKFVVSEMLSGNSPAGNDQRESDETKDSNLRSYGGATAPIPCCNSIGEGSDGRTSGFGHYDANDFTSSEASFSASAGSPRSFGDNSCLMTAGAMFGKMDFSNTRWSQPVDRQQNCHRPQHGIGAASLHSLSSSPPQSADCSPKMKDYEEAEDAKTDSELENLAHPTTSLVKRKQSSDAHSTTKLGCKKEQVGRAHQQHLMDEDDDRCSSVAPELNDLGLAVPMNFLPRVASFGAFDSPPLYDVQSSERQVSKLRKERRRALTATQEYQQLRLVFAKESVTNIVSRELRAKVKTGGRSDTF